MFRLNRRWLSTVVAVYFGAQLDLRIAAEHLVGSLSAPYRRVTLGQGKPAKDAEWLCLVPASKDAEESTLIIFAEGGAVGWNTTEEQLLEVHKKVVRIARVSSRQLPLEQPVVETASYEHVETDTAGDEGVVSTAGGTLRLTSNDPLEKLPFSFGLAHSVKLDALDAAVNPVAIKVKAWQIHLAESGRLPCRVTNLRREKAKLLSIMELVNYQENTQTTPKIFWSGDLQKYRDVFHDVAEYLELEGRKETLKEKMETVDETLSYLHEEVHVTTEEILTWIIIWLIAFELFVAFGVFRLLGTMLVFCWRLMLSVGA